MIQKIGAGFTILTLLALGACKPGPERTRPPRRVFAIRVADSSGLTERAFPGRARAGQEVNLSFRVAGPLIAFPADVGTQVKAGDELARIDPQDFEMAVRNLEAQVEREQARAKRADQDLTRIMKIFNEDPGATSQAAIDRAKQTADSANANVRSLEASVTTTKNRLSYTHLKAPFDGVVVETYVENFETVVPKQPVLRLLDPSSIEFVISVPENSIGYAPYVESIDVKFDALPGVNVPARIKEIGKEATQATRTFPVTLVMAQPPGAEILPGMAGQASISAKLPEQAKETGIEIPATAVFSKGDAQESFVWVIHQASKKLTRRRVEVGQLSRFGILIRSGLQPGEWIVTKGVHSVEEGETIRMIDNSKEDSTS